MIVLTPAERRAALLLALLLVLGALTDLVSDRWPARHAATADASRPVEVVATLPGDSAGATRLAPVSAATLDLNRATARELDTLPGLGPVLAARIIDHRQRYGAFRELDDLRAVRGIGPKLFARLKDRVRIDPAP